MKQNYASSYIPCLSSPVYTFTYVIVTQDFCMLQRPKYNNMEPDPIEFFGECMNSPQNGRTPLANDIYVSTIINGYMYYDQ